MNVQEQTEVILARLRQAMATQTPVMGRILNAVNRGYSVGVAGLVCFLPITQCLFQVRTVKLLLTFWPLWYPGSSMAKHCVVGLACRRQPGWVCCSHSW